MKFSFSRSLTTLVAALTILSLVSPHANAQQEFGQSWFGDAYSRSGSDVQSLYDSNASRPLGGLFAPGFTRTLTVLGGFNFPSAGVSERVTPTQFFPADPLAADFIALPRYFNRLELDDTGYALSFAFGRRHSRSLRSEIELAFRSNDINSTFNSPVLVGGVFVPDRDISTEDGRVNATSLMKNFIFDFDNSTRFTPYVGAGLGLTYIDIEAGESGSLDGEPTFRDNETLFSYQAIAGVATQLNSVADFIVEYRFLGTSEVEFDGLDKSVVYNTSNLFMGVKFEY